MQTWSFAASTNNDGLLSAVTSVLALLLKTISTILALRECGSQLCKTLLQQAQLKLLSRALAAPRQKEHVISPALRLLTEITTFDGGAEAKRVWTARTFTFDGKIVSRNLSLWKPLSAEKDDGRQRPSVRSNAIRYVLAHFRLQSATVKVELLKHGNILRSLFEHLKYDPPEVLRDVLNTVRSSILANSAIPKINKSWVLNEQNLCSIAAIYRQDQSPSEAGRVPLNSRNMIHEFLKYACTTSDAGALKPFASWYPPGTDKEVKDQDQDDDIVDIDLGLSSVDWYDRYHGQVTVRNNALSTLARFLRPYADVLESELLIEILQAAPELFADYFFKRSGFTFEPKLTATWIGYSAFLYSAVSLPVPEFLGGRDGYGIVPPPVSIVIESILPQPLSQKVLIRCLNQQTELITFFALRILVVAFEKFRKVLECFVQGVEEHGELWREATERLRNEFALRCPPMKDVIGTFRKTNEDSTLQRQVSLRLLLQYYQLVPQLASEEKFDVSLPLAQALACAGKDNESVPQGDNNDEMQVDTDIRTDKLEMLQLTHLLQIARFSSDMRWWHRPESLTFSTFTTLLKVVVTAPNDKVLPEMRSLLESIILEYDILQSSTSKSAFRALTASLARTDHFEPSDALFAFLDDAFGRLTRKPIKYQDDLDDVRGENKSEPVSLLLMTVAEQWPYQEGNESAKNIASWLGRFIAACELIGENRNILRKLQKQLKTSTKTKETQDKFSAADVSDLQGSLKDEDALASSHTEKASKSSAVHVSAQPFEADLALYAPPVEDEKHSGLYRWQDKDLTTAATDGDFSALILCLSSDYPEVRRAALTQVLAAMRKLSRPTQATKVEGDKKSGEETRKPAQKTASGGANLDSFSEGYQYYLLFGILSTTATLYILRNEPVPFLCTSYAATVAGQILHDPLHPMYERVCRFHTRTPKWDVERLPSWWIHQILYNPAPVSGSFNTHKQSIKTFSESTKDDGVEVSDVRNARSDHHAGLLFLTNYIFSSLRTEADLQILRQRGTFEPLFSLAASPYMPWDVQEALLKIVWRTTFIPGGSTTLITREGIFAWLSARLATQTRQRRRTETEIQFDVSGDAALRLLVSRLWKTCDQQRVEEWSKGTVERLLQNLGAVSG